MRAGKKVAGYVLHFHYLENTLFARGTLAESLSDLGSVPYQAVIHESVS